MMTQTLDAVFQDGGVLNHWTTARFLSRKANG